jgi:putative flippase GtrA
MEPLEATNIDRSQLKLGKQLIVFAAQGLFLNLAGYVIFIFLFSIAGLGALLSSLVAALIVIPASAVIQGQFVFKQKSPRVAIRIAFLLLLTSCSALTIHIVDLLGVWNVPIFQAGNQIFWAFVSFFVARQIK